MRLANPGYTLGLFAAVAMLFGCGGSQPPIGTSGTMPQSAASKAKTFYYAGKQQSFIVPHSIRHVTVTATGAPTKAANSGLVSATIPVMPDEPLAVFVGGEPLIAYNFGP